MRPHRGPQRVEVPLLREALGRGGDVGGDGVVDHRADLVVQVGALEHRAALAVDDLALAAHHVVVLEDVLAGLEVHRLDLRLRGLDRLGHRLVLDRDVVGDLEREQHPLHPVGLEQPHQVVAEREVEPGLAGVALTAGTTAQLVVDAARLVALGAEDVEAAGLLDLVVLGLDLGGDPLEGRRPGGVRTPRRSRPGRGPALRSSWSARNSVEPPSMMSVPRPAMLVATVTAPLWPAMRDDLGLVGVLLGVQHRVRDAAASSAGPRAARTSRPRWCRPAPAGPLRWRSAMSSTTALNFASSVR